MTQQLIFFIRLWVSIQLTAGYKNVPGIFSARGSSTWCLEFARHDIHIFGKNLSHVCRRPAHEARFFDNPACKIFRVAVLKDETDFKHDCFATDEKGKFVLKESYSTFLLEMLIEALNAEMSVIRPHISEDLKNRNIWNELADLLIESKADIAICHFTVTVDRLSTVGFLNPTFTTSQSFVFIPERLPLVKDVLVLTFSANFWLCFLAAAVLIIVCLRFSSWCLSNVRPYYEPWSWMEVILMVTASICQQSYSRHPKGISGGTTFIIGYLYAYLLYTAFAAGVTSLLAVQGRDVFLAVSDVLAMKLTLYSTFQIPTKVGRLDSSNQGASWLGHDWSKMHKMQVVESFKEVFENISEDDTIGIGGTVGFNNYIWRQIEYRKRTNLYLSEIIDSIDKASFIIRKNLPCKELLNMWILRLHEYGFVDLGTSRYLKVPYQRKAEPPGWSSAGLGNISSAMYILAAGYFFSVFFLFCEIAWIKKTINFRSLVN